MILLARKYWVSGRVQGVGFRFFAEREAKSLGLRGYVRNLADGRVEAYAIGDQRSLKKFKRRLVEGPASAHVTHVEEFEEPLGGDYSDFEIGM
ncbi:MAG: acylphosphatase [Terriglobia bacterium]